MIAKGNYSVYEIIAEAESYFSKVGKGRGTGYKPYKRWEYQALRNCDENGMLKSSDFYFNELERHNNTLNQNALFSAASDTGNWEELGPTYWNQTSGWNPGVGRITSIAVQHNNLDHIIVGGETGGVWKTTNGGVTWTVLTDNLSNLHVYSLTIDPLNASVYYWGSTNGTIFKSTDAGLTWNLLADVGNGVVNKILIDPVNTNKMYCSSEDGGIFKSTNGGLNWALIHSAATSGFDVEFKPGNTNTIYASGNSFFISTDGGTTFSQLGNDLTNWTQEYVSGNVNWVPSNANQNNTITAKTGSKLGLFYFNNYSGPKTKLVSQALDLSGAVNPTLSFSYTQVNWDGDIDELRVFYKTTASGSWNILATYTSEVTTWADIVLSLPNPTATYYIAFEAKSNYGRGVTLDDISVQATNLGQLLFEGFESSVHDFGTGPKMIGVSNADAEIVYVLEAQDGKFGGIHKSINGGFNFTKLNHPNKNYFGYSSLADDDSGQAPRDMDIAVNPLNANEVHIAGILTWLSTDGGLTFTITSQWVPQNALAQNIGYSHCDMDIMEYIGGKLYVGSDGGISIANNPTTVNSNYFTNLSVGLGIRQFYKIGISQTNPVIMTGGSQDNGTSVFRTDGAWYDWLGADGMETFVDKTNSNILYGTTQFGSLYKSLNAGNTRLDIATPDNKSGNWVTPFEQDPMVANVIYTGYDQVYKSTNSGDSWTAISQNFGGNLDHLKIAPSNNQIMFASRGSNLYKTLNGGLTNWTQVTGFLGSINAIAIHPTNPNQIAIATTAAQKVYVSNDGGATWNSYLYNLPNFSAQALVWENNTTNGLYLGMNYGVYYIDNDSSNQWKTFSNNLPNVIISELEINYVDSKIYAGTYGRGLWRSNLYDETLGFADNVKSTLQIYPNPASDEFTLTLDSSNDVSIKIFDSLGKLVHYTAKANLNNAYKIDISSLTSGIYFVRINGYLGEITKKLIVK